MFSEDYVLRMINQAVAALVKILGLKKAGRHEEAHQAIDQALEVLLGLRGDLVRRMDDEGLLAMLNLEDQRVDLERLAVIADLFKEDGEILAAQGYPDEGVTQSARALRFYLEVALGDPLLRGPELAQQIDRLYQALAMENLPLETRFALLDYYERRLAGEAPGPAQVGENLLPVENIVKELRDQLAGYLED
jgi:hypothetical protein